MAQQEKNIKNVIESMEDRASKQDQMLDLVASEFSKDSKKKSDILLECEQLKQKVVETIYAVRLEASQLGKQQQEYQGHHDQITLNMNADLQTMKLEMNQFQMQIQQAILNLKSTDISGVDGSGACSVSQNVVLAKLQNNLKKKQQATTNRSKMLEKVNKTMLSALAKSKKTKNKEIVVSDLTNETEKSMKRNSSTPSTL